MYLSVFLGLWVLFSDALHAECGDDNIFVTEGVNAVKRTYQPKKYCEKTCTWI